MATSWEEIEVDCKYCSEKFTVGSLHRRGCYNQYFGQSQPCAKHPETEQYHDGGYFEKSNEDGGRYGGDRWACCEQHDSKDTGCKTRQKQHECTPESTAAAQQQAAANLEAEEAEEKFAPLIELFPVTSASEIAADVKAASEAYHSKMRGLVARAQAVVAKEGLDKAADAAAAAAAASADADVERLTAELAAMKAARDFKGAKAAKAALEEAKVVAAKQATAGPPAAEVAPGDSLASWDSPLRVEVRLLADCCEAYGYAVGNPSKFERLRHLASWCSPENPLIAAYRWKSDQLLEADDFDLAEEYDTASTAASEYWGLDPAPTRNGWAKLFPALAAWDETRSETSEAPNEIWGPLAMGCDCEK